jgi:hypothetical protein
MKKSICIFLRTDLTPIQQVVQASHVCVEVARRFIEDTEERYKLVILGVRSEDKLKKVIEEIKNHKISYREYTEPDMDYQLTAVATEPLDDEKKFLFSRYRLLQLPDETNSS